MLLRASVLLLLGASLLRAVDLPYYNVEASCGPGWGGVLSSIGFEARATDQSRVVVICDSTIGAGDWAKRVRGGVILVVQGPVPAFGFEPGPESVRVSGVRDVHSPDLSILWEQPARVAVFAVPLGAAVFARDRSSGAPLIAGFRSGKGAVLWTAVGPGLKGYERFPYLPQALVDLGLEPPFRSARLWAFFDSAYRSRVDLDYFASRWRKAGISTLQVAGWHFFEPSAEGDEYLRRLIQACHRQGILVYAWLELPHVSEAFWASHPAWREKTGLGQDAQLDWRKLMNLTNRECFRSVAGGVRQLMARFDWDGVNLAELYFESLEGLDNPARFTPMNSDVREQFLAQAGFDPIELFGKRSDSVSRKLFLDFRRLLVQRMQTEWLDEMEAVRKTKRDLDVVLTHVDDRFDERMRDAIGVDSAKVLPLLEKHDFTFLIEDPATVWNLGSERYQVIAGKYIQMTPRADRLAIDINIVERYQDVYPTRQQTGSELFELVHAAAANFSRVALYFENSLLAPDLGILPLAAATARKVDGAGSGIRVDSSSPLGVAWRGSAMVDGREWPICDGETVWLPAGVHTVMQSDQKGPRVVRLNAELLDARRVGSREIEFRYESSSRSIALLDRKPGLVRMDGVVVQGGSTGTDVLLLPRGRHLVTIAWD